MASPPAQRTLKMAMANSAWSTEEGARQLTQKRLFMEDTARLKLTQGPLPLEQATKLCEGHQKWREEGYDVDSEFSIFQRTDANSIDSAPLSILNHRALMPMCLNCAFNKIVELRLPPDEPIGHIDTCLCASTFFATECSYCEILSQAALKASYIEDRTINIAGMEALRCNCGDNIMMDCRTGNILCEILRYCAGCAGVVSVPVHGFDGFTHLASPFMRPSYMDSGKAVTEDLLGNPSPCLHHPVETWGTRLQMMMKMARGRGVSVQPGNLVEPESALPSTSTPQTGHVTEQEGQTSTAPTSPVDTPMQEPDEPPETFTQPAKGQETMPPPQTNRVRRRSSAASAPSVTRQIDQSPKKQRVKRHRSQTTTGHVQQSQASPAGPRPLHVLEQEYEQFLNQTASVQQQQQQQQSQMRPSQARTSLPDVNLPIANLQLQGLMAERGYSNMSPPNNAAHVHYNSASITHLQPMRPASSLLPAFPSTSMTPRNAPVVPSMRQNPQQVPSYPSNSAFFSAGPVNQFQRPLMASTNPGYGNTEIEALRQQMVSQYGVGSQNHAQMQRMMAQGASEAMARRVPEEDEVMESIEK